MEAKTTEWRPGPTVCRCCLTEGCYKDISTEYFWMGKREVYSEMLSETLDLNIAYSQSGGPNSNSRLICEPCISRLRDATDFKRQVLECERSFMQYLDPVGSGDIGVNIELDKDVKIERVKDEKTLLDDDDEEFVPPEFGDGDEDDDDLDDQPLTKLASKIPKKESVDVLDLLDNAKITEKRKSSSKSKSSPAKKSKLKKEVASSSKVKPEPRKKKGAKTAFETSIWQLTVPERNNAATFIQYTSVQPFTFMGSSFKCFFCMQYFSEPKSLLEHTRSHDIRERDDLLEKYIPKGKRILQVDISRLKCNLCELTFPNLTLIRDHLKMQHDKHFLPASNGMTEYNMELQNGYYVCHICNKDFHSFALLNSHMNCHVGKVVCESCGIGFLNQHLLMKHREIHLINKFKCQNCEKTFTKKSQVKYHTEIVHKGRERVKLKKCPKCNESFKEHYSKTLHLKAVHGITKSFQCHICKTNFSTRRALTEHTTRYHTEKYKCEVCCKCFSIESKLKQHMRGHTSERNFICNICKNAYMHKMTLQKHMRSHNTFKFNCPDCKTGFHNKIEYTKHIRQWHFYGDE